MSEACGCGSDDRPGEDEQEPERLWEITELRAAAVAGVVLLAGYVVGWSGGPHAVEIGLYALALVIGAYTFVPSTLRRLAQGKIGVGTLMTIAAVGAVILGEVGEAAMLAFLFSISEGLEEYSLARTRRGLRALLSLVRWVGATWWLWGFGLLYGFQLLMLVLYPKLILPLFNKLTPLPAGELRARLLALGERTGFRAQTIEVMDGSKRSGHSNAFFTGFGRFRRIVLFDTLIAQLTPDELEAVLAHEIGHYRRGHIPKMLAVSAVTMLAGFAVVAWLAASPWFNLAFGFPPGELAPAFLLFGLLSGSVMFWFTPLMNLFSRKHEYEADAFAREAVGGPGPLLGALRKLAQKNLSNLTPHRWFSAFYYSHPTLVEREAALVR